MTGFREIGGRLHDKYEKVAFERILMETDANRPYKYWLLCVMVKCSGAVHTHTHARAHAVYDEQAQSHADTHVHMRHYIHVHTHPHT